MLSDEEMDKFEKLNSAEIQKLHEQMTTIHIVYDGDIIRMMRGDGKVLHEGIIDRPAWWRDIIEFIDGADSHDIIRLMKDLDFQPAPIPDGNEGQWFAGWLSPTGQVFGVWDDTPEGAVRSAAVMAIQETNAS